MDNREILLKVQKATGLTQKAFAEYFEILEHTLQDWLGGILLHVV